MDELSTGTGPAEGLTDTRRAWHGAAELLLAGPQYRRSGTIRLRVSPGGFATITAPDLRVEGDHLVAGGSRLPMFGRTYAELGELLGLDAGAPAGVYGGGSGVRPEEVVTVAAPAAAYLADCFARGDAALRAFAPEQTPVLWPEHFDVAVTVDEVNYGVSAGDDFLAEPYAYVGPWEPIPAPFFNAPFGAALPMTEFPDPRALVDFFARGRAAAGR
jgi:hypothetical protein